jgi:hypothetical protein
LPPIKYRYNPLRLQQKNEKPPLGSPSLVYEAQAAGLAQADSLRRANTCACAALCAGVSVNYVLIFALRDCLNGALTLTCTARDTVITNYVCHNLFLFLNDLLILRIEDAKIRTFSE